MSDDRDDEGTAAAPWPPLSPWHEPLVRTLLADRARWPHALLLAGPAGIGKRIAAQHLARALLCERPRDGGIACGECDGCRYVAAGQHPDLRVVAPIERDDDGVEKRLDAIPVTQIRALTDFVQLTSHRQGNKVALIAPAERMNASAANALLKTLEEPPANTYLLLVADQPGRLPATVVSRCRRIDVPAPARADALAWLTARGVRDAANALAQAGGAPYSALALSSLQAERRAWLAALEEPARLSALALASRIDLAPRDERKDRLAAAIDWMLGWTTDLARVAAGGDARSNPDAVAALASLAKRVARVPLSRYHRSLLEHRARVSHPLTPRLVAEALLIDYQELFDDGG